MGGPIFNGVTLKNRMVRAGHPVKGWGFMTPAEKARMADKTAMRRELKRDTGRADVGLKKF